MFVEATALAAWNRPGRRLATGVIVLGAIVAAVGFALQTRSREDPRVSRSRRAPHASDRECTATSCSG
jgi:hypothetical protein